jgi:hypothetical protein
VEERREAHLCAGFEGPSLICSTAWHLLSSVPSWHTIVRISLERNVRISSRHPHVERVMHEQIGQQRTDHPRIDDALPQHDIPQRRATGGVEDGRLRLAQVHQGEWTPTPLSATLARQIGRASERWLRGEWAFTGPHDQFAELDPTQLRSGDGRG